MVNMFKARENRTVRLNLRPADWETLEEWAEANDLRVSEMIAQCLHTHIRQQQAKADEQLQRVVVRR